jgi:hypothetical protein
MDCYDQDTRRLLCRERVEQLARDGQPRRERKRRHRARLYSLRELLRPAAYRRARRPQAAA